jgi:hypothetical protein
MKAPVAVFTWAPRMACGDTVGPSTVGQPQPAACAAGSDGGVAVVRGWAAADGAEMASEPSGCTTVIVAV